MSPGKREAKVWREYSKVITSLLTPVLTILAVGFVIFVCYEMHRLEDLSPVPYLAPPIIGVPVAVVGLYMWRAKAKSKTDLEWEQTKQLTLFREKHPEYFTQGNIALDDDMTTMMTDDGGNG